MPPITRAEADGRDLEELRARVALVRDVDCASRPAPALAGTRAAAAASPAATSGVVRERACPPSGRGPRGTRRRARRSRRGRRSTRRRSARPAARRRRWRSRPARGSGPGRAGGRRGSAQGAQAGFKRSGQTAVNVVTGGANSDGSRRSLRRGTVSEPVLGPAPVDELAHLGAHLDLRRPLPRPLERALRGGVDPDLAADELERRRMVEVVERPLGDARRRASGRRSRRRRTSPARSRARRRARRRRRCPSSG